ncbi:MAG: hypothetical protein ACE5DR_01125, partial [Thermodesulfobacteriota bacterium]
EAELKKYKLPKEKKIEKKTRDRVLVPSLENSFMILGSLLWNYGASGSSPLLPLIMGLPALGSVLTPRRQKKTQQHLFRYPGTRHKVY